MRCVHTSHTSKNFFIIHLVMLLCHLSFYTNALKIIKRIVFASVFFFFPFTFRYLKIMCKLLSLVKSKIFRNDACCFVWRIIDFTICRAHENSVVQRKIYFKGKQNERKFLTRLWFFRGQTFQPLTKFELYLWINGTPFILQLFRFPQPQIFHSKCRETLAHSYGKYFHSCDVPVLKCVCFFRIFGNNCRFKYKYKYASW